MADEERGNVNRRVRATGDDAKRLIAMMRAAFPDAKFSLVQRVQDQFGDAAFVWSARAEHCGDVEGFSATGATASIVAVASAQPRRGDAKQ